MHTTSYIKKILSDKYPLYINEKVINQIATLVRTYEIKGYHSLALNTPLLAVRDKKRDIDLKIWFLETDQENLFNLFGYEKNKFKRDIKHIPSIDTDRIVTSDPYNIFTTWVCHCIYNSEVPIKLRNQGIIDLLKLLHYKFFSSFVNHTYKFGANEAIMRKTIESLNNKYDIIKYGSWKKVIEARSEDILFGRVDAEDKKPSKASIHIDTIKNYEPDERVFYLITDTLGRIKSRIKNINTIFFDFQKKGEGIGDYELVTELDGKKIINGTRTLESMITNLSNSALNINTFIDNILIKDICNDIFKGNLKHELFRSLLISFSELSTIQSKSGDLDKYIKLKNGKIIYEGTRILLANIIQKTYRYCIMNKVNMDSKRDIVIRTKNLYSASRINDVEILNIKDSLDELIKELIYTKRAATLASLKIAFIIYIIMRSFAYL